MKESLVDENFAHFWIENWKCMKHLEIMNEILNVIENIIENDFLFWDVHLF